MGKNATSFKPGVSGNPYGKPAGTTTPLSRIKHMILDVFQKHEAEFERELDTLATTRPIDYYNGLVAPFMPKELKVDADINDKRCPANTTTEALKTIDDLEKRIKSATKNRAKRS